MERFVINAEEVSKESITLHLDGVLPQLHSSDVVIPDGLKNDVEPSGQEGTLKYYTHRRKDGTSDMKQLKRENLRILRDNVELTMEELECAFWTEIESEAVDSSMCTRKTLGAGHTLASGVDFRNTHRCAIGSEIVLQLLHSDTRVL